jgi:hypothetical protein
VAQEPRAWTESPVHTVQSGPLAARFRGIRTGSAYGARGRSSHNPPIVGSSPTRPTCGYTLHPVSPVDRCRRYRMSPDRPSGPALAVPDLTAARTGPNPAAIPANPQAPLWRPAGQDSPAPHRNGASRAAGFSHTAQQRPGTAEGQKAHSGAISGGDCDQGNVVRATGQTRS